MFEAFFTDPCMRYRTEVINGIDFYGLGFSMVRGECVAEGTLRWMQEGEAAAVLITNTSLPDMSGFELARHVRRQFPCLRVIFLTDTPNLAEAQQAVRCGAYDYLPKSDGIDALRSAMIRVSEELHTESREEAYLRGQQNWDGTEAGHRRGSLANVFQSQAAAERCSAAHGGSAGALFDGGTARRNLPQG